MDNDDGLHVVLGAGQIGTRIVERLLARGQRVRLVSRSSSPQARPRLERVRGDLRDLAFAAEALRGARVVYDCMNPAYDRWPEELLPIARGALYGAARAGARLVALDCLYMYGRPDEPMREDTPLAPQSRKGALRVQLGELRLAAHQRGEVPVAIGRASDFFGAALPWSAWSDRFYGRVLAGKPAQCMGDPDQLHSYTYADDVADALLLLGERAEAPGRVWHLPTAPAESTRALATRLGQALRLTVRVEQVPRWMMRAAGLFSPMLREVAEMMYQWDGPFVLDDSRFRATFGMAATPVETQVARTAAWAREHYRLRAAA